MNIDELREIWTRSENHPVDVGEILHLVCDFCDDIGGDSTIGSHTMDHGGYRIDDAAGMLFRLCAEALGRMVAS